MLAQRRPEFWNLQRISCRINSPHKLCCEAGGAALVPVGRSDDLDFCLWPEDDPARHPPYRIGVAPRPPGPSALSSES